MLEVQLCSELDHGHHPLSRSKEKNLDCFHPLLDKSLIHESGHKDDKSVLVLSIWMIVAAQKMPGDHDKLWGVQVDSSIEVKPFLIQEQIGDKVGGKESSFKYTDDGVAYKISHKGLEGRIRTYHDSDVNKAAMETFANYQAATTPPRPQRSGTTNRNETGVVAARSPSTDARKTPAKSETSPSRKSPRPGGKKKSKEGKSGKGTKRKASAKKQGQILRHNKNCKATAEEEDDDSDYSGEFVLFVHLVTSIIYLHLLFIYIHSNSIRCLHLIICLHLF